VSVGSGRLRQYWRKRHSSGSRTSTPLAIPPPKVGSLPLIDFIFPVMICPAADTCICLGQSTATSLSGSSGVREEKPGHGLAKEIASRSLIWACPGSESPPKLSSHADIPSLGAKYTEDSGTSYKRQPGNLHMPQSTFKASCGTSTGLSK
jgi:hypothetical protein